MAKAQAMKMPIAAASENSDRSRSTSAAPQIADDLLATLSASPFSDEMRHR
jgi:hypothetical protein